MNYGEQASIILDGRIVVGGLLIGITFMVFKNLDFYLDVGNQMPATFNNSPLK